MFANAQSGNVVLLGTFAAAGQWGLAWRHIPPICAFLIGVFTARSLRAHSPMGGARGAALLSLAVEIGLLVIVAMLPVGVPDLPIVLSIAFVAALQSSGFAQVEGWGYSSVMTTGNLRHMAEALFDGIGPPRDAGSVRRGSVFALICGTFALGAAAGAALTSTIGNAALAAPIALLGLALLLCLVIRPAKAVSGRA